MSAKSKKTPRQLSESVEGYQDILGSIEEGYFEVDLAGNLTFFNDSMCRIAGLPRDKLMGMNNRDYTTPETAKNMYEAFNEIYRTGRSAKVMDYEIIRKDGVRRNLELSASLIRDTNGEPTGYRGIVRDVTERRRTEQEILRFKMGIERSHEAIFLTDPDGTITYVNPAFEQIYGFRYDEAVGQTPRILKSGQHPPETYEEFWKTILSKKVMTGELINKTKDGRYIDVEGSANPILDDQSEIVGFLAIQRDITERKRAEEEIRQRTADVALINQVNNALNSGATLEEVIRLFSDTIKEMYSDLGVVGAAVFLLSEDRERLMMQNLPLSEKVIRQLEKLTGRTLPKFTLNLAEGPLHREVLEGGQIRVLDTRKAIQQWMREFVTDSWIRSTAVRGQLRKLAPQVRKLLGYEYSVILPLKTEGETIGLMEISSETPFTEFDIGRLAMISSQLTTAINDKQTGDALRESEARLRSLSDGAFEGIAISEAGKVIDANKALCEILGYSRGEIIGCDVLEFIAPDDRELVMDRIRTSREESYEHKALRKDGTIIDVEVRPSSTQYQGRDVRMTAIRDVTKNKRAEEALRLTQFSVDHVSDAAYWMGSDARFVYVNEAACRSLGYSREELLAMTVHDIDPNFPAEIWPAHWEELQREGSLILNSQHRKKDGDLIPVEITTNYVEYGGQEYNCAFARDITSRLAAAAALHESERMLRELHENALEGIFRTDAEGKVLYANEAIARMFGFESIEEFRQSNVADLYHEGSERGKVLRQLDSSDFVQNLELHLHRKDGSDIWVQENAIAVRDDTGKVKWYEGFLSDITDRKEAEEALLQSEEELRQAQKMEAAGHLAGGIAHDFNNVLAQISAATELLDAKVEQKPARRYLDIILGAVERGKSVTERILRFSRRTKPKYESFSILMLLNDIVHVLRHTLPKSVRVNLEAEEQEFSAWGDKGQLHQ
jgi:PAS domain S-box-containing protein